MSREQESGDLIDSDDVVTILFWAKRAETCPDHLCQDTSSTQVRSE
jgi:hypothetical protein